MVLFAEDPNLAVQPDFTTDLHQAARDQLVNNAVDEAQAALILAALWDINNNAAKEHWAERLAEEARITEAREQQAAEEELQRRRAEEEDERTILDEERKKNKSKYAPFRDLDVPSEPLVIPSYYASRKMKKGDFCELYYFTNAGLQEARKDNLTVDSEALVMLPASDGQHCWIPAGAARDPRAVISEDENLSWEEFNQAAPRMINAMKENSWPEARIDMHIQFWSSLQNHRWRHAHDVIKQRALLVYQGQQRRRWHLTIGGPNSYSLARINRDLLDETKEDLLDQSRNRAALLAGQVRSISLRVHAATTYKFRITPPYFCHSRHPSYSCGPFMCPRALLAGHSCTLTHFMRAIHVPSHTSCGPFMCPRTHADQSRVLAPSRTYRVSLHSHIQTRVVYQAPSEANLHPPGHLQANSRALRSQKRALSPSTTDTTIHAAKKPRSFRENPSSSTLPCCAICLGRNPHRIIECSIPRTWDNLHDTFAERIDKVIWTKDGRQLCPAWQRAEGCSNSKHDTRHLCSGCGSSSHGAQRCPRAQKA